MSALNRRSLMSNSFPFKANVFKSFPAGDFFRANAANFPVLKGLAVQALEILPGGVREPHTHPNANQLDFCIQGKGLVGIVGPDGQKQYLELAPGDISFVPQGHLHWIENLGDEPLSFLVVLSHELPETIEFSEMFAGVPNSTLAKMYEVPESAFEQIPERTVIIGGVPAMSQFCEAAE
ncbi:cupin domain-containing protein [Rhizobium oryzicola]|uniref:Cupin domain-containing protein n=1 Tax=Rhizobium oryzicola TaxID=1232668 RepID=A0ABT8SVK2_9HYPH|nr:cupin domain-containing protein [Rhizobium oryzicola]MDO1582450.1 cupin domain-containing protein [Rhizobium oryzicola]